MEAAPDGAVDIVPLDRYDPARAKIAANLQWICAKAYGRGGPGAGEGPCRPLCGVPARGVGGRRSRRCGEGRHAPAPRGPNAVLCGRESRAEILVTPALFQCVRIPGVGFRNEHSFRMDRASSELLPSVNSSFEELGNLVTG